MTKTDKLELKMNEVAGLEGKSVATKTIFANGCSLLRLRECMYSLGDIVTFDEENEILIVAFRGKSSFANAMVGFELKNDVIKILSVSKEGLIKQHISEKNAETSIAAITGKKVKKNRSQTIPMICILIAAIMVVAALCGCSVEKKADKDLLQKYDNLIKNYNQIVDTYNSEAKIVCPDSGMEIPVSMTEWQYDNSVSNKSYDDVEAIINDKLVDLEEAGLQLIAIKQIDKPEEDFVINRLSTIDGVKEIGAVTKDNDPNGLLGKEGAYYSCIYFSLSNINGSSIPGTTAVDKGTDAGGAVELYSSHEDALNRCDYLAQFDETILNAGSYQAFGTMVIRTSYQLVDEDQQKVTDAIVSALLAIYSEEPVAPEKMLSASKEPETIKSLDTENINESAVNTIVSDNIEVYGITDYSHNYEDTEILGNEESLYMTVVLLNENCTADDIILEFDENMLTVNKPTSETSDGKVNVTFVITGKSAGTSEIDIYTAYEYLNAVKGSYEADCWYLTVQKLNETEGKIVYVNEDSDVYHYSSSCAGDDSFETTLFDVQSVNYVACTDCVK